MIPVRQSTGFPIVAKIRKGTPKQKIIKTYNGEQREVEIMGNDLKNKFRIEFLPGTDTKREDGQLSIREKWHALHEKDYVKYPKTFVTPDGYEVAYLYAMIPTEKVFDGWQWSNVTYNAAGMKIAEADGDHYITKRDPVTMEYLIKDGQPYEKFSVGDAISYERGGKQYKLKLKSTAKLALFLPELFEFVRFELRTTSYYDSLYIQENLNAIQGIANILNGGIAGGIPLDVYRIELDAPYHDDSGAHKSKKWFIQIKANIAWANAAIGRMNQFALMGEAVASLLPPLTIPVIENSASLVDDEIDDDEEGTKPESVEGELGAESPKPTLKPSQIITDSEWEAFGKLVQRATNAGLVLPEYIREKMTPDTLNGATQYIKGKLRK